MRFREHLEDIHEQKQDEALLQPYIQAVAGYLGVRPKIANFYKYSEEEWGLTFGNDHEMLLGRTAAMYDTDRNLHVRQGRAGHIDEEGTLLHEMVHAAGFDKFQMVSREVNEGMTQVVAEEIGRLNKMSVTATYHREVTMLKKFVLPLIGQDLRKLAREYARVPDPALLLAGSVWSKYWTFFQDRNDWGDIQNCRKHFLETFKQDPFNSFPYLEHIWDELKVRRQPQAHRLPIKHNHIIRTPYPPGPA